MRQRVVKIEDALKSVSRNNLTLWVKLGVNISIRVTPQARVTGITSCLCKIWRVIGHSIITTIVLA